MSSRSMNKYLEELNNKNELNHEFFEELRSYADANNVPIIERSSLMTIKSIIMLTHPKRILEIGTAIAYSSLSFASCYNDIIVDTIERNPEMIEQAKANIKKAGMEDRVILHEGDALLIDNDTLSKYDLIFIDAAKAQYQKFFDKYSPLLNDNGYIITDNILFHGCVENQNDLSKNVLGMAKKLDSYNHTLTRSDSFETIYLDCGDGLAITKRK